MDEENVACIDNRILFRHQNNEILSFKGTLMEPKAVMVSEISQKKKDEYLIILLTYKL